MKSIWTNGAYTIKGKLTGFGKRKRIKGVCTKSKYRTVYEVGDKVDTPLYHNPTDDKPQWEPLKPIEMTVEEIEEALGHPVKIVSKKGMIK